MRIFSKTIILFFGFLALLSCDADGIATEDIADGDDGVIIESPIEPEDKNGDGLPDLPL